MKKTTNNQVQPIQSQVISNPFSDKASHNIEPAPSLPTQPATSLASEGVSDSPTSPSTATDSDLIEKTWIGAIEKIAKEYGDDPYLLQEQQAKFARDYLKKRFGREIKGS